MIPPPSTIIVWPVLNDAASEARNATAENTSSNSPMRASGVASTTPAVCSSLYSVTPPAGADRPKVRLFRDWQLEEASTEG